MPLNPAKRRQDCGECEVIRQAFPHFPRGVEMHRFPFAQQQQAERVVEVGVGQQHALDRAIARRFRAGMERRKGIDLRAKIGRGIDQKPAPAIATQRDARLCLRRNFPTPRGLAIAARAIPLRQPTAGGGTEDADANGSPRVGLNPGRVGGALQRDAHGLHLGFDPLFLALGSFHGVRPL